MLHYIRIDLYDYNKEINRSIVTTTISKSRETAMKEIYNYAYIYAYNHNCKVLMVEHVCEETI